MFAIIETGGKQYKVSEGKTVKIEKLPSQKGEKAVFENVLLVVDGDTVTLGRPYIDKARVEAEVVEQGRSRKKIVFRYHSKTRYRKKKGHRQHFTEVRIDKITAK